MRMRTTCANYYWKKSLLQVYRNFLSTKIVKTKHTFNLTCASPCLTLKRVVKELLDFLERML